MPEWRKLFVVLASVVALAVCVAPAGANTASGKVVALRNSIADKRQSTWNWQALALKSKTRSVYSERTTHSPKYLMWLNHLWSQRMLAAKWLAQHPPHLRQWMCIHHYEGSWTDPNSPYYGGLQMDMSFMQAYGGQLLSRKGTADHWTPLEQMWVAERAYSSGRGFNPWPNTARWCGLL